MFNKLIRKWCNRIMDSREPDIYIGGKADPYLLRWWVVPRNRFFNLYLHRVHRSDDDRALHDHPWLNMSYIVEGGYDEISFSGAWDQVGKVRTRRTAGDIKFRLPTDLHRLEVIQDEGGQRPCVTLFFTGPRVRTWGFKCPQGWVKWTDFVQKSGDESVNVTGCGEVPTELLHSAPPKSSWRKMFQPIGS
jgi:hypothetical protein